MSDDARDSLAAIAARAGVKTRAANLSYRGVRDTFERRCTVRVRGIPIEVFASPTMLYVQMKRESGVLFATPRRDPILGLISLLGQVAGHDVYVHAAGLGSPVPWVYGRHVVAALGRLDLHDDELLTVNLGGASALMSPRGDEDWARLERLAGLLELAPQGPAAATTDAAALPADLRELQPLLEQWGRSDDSERSDLIEAAGTRSLEELVWRVGPKLQRIAEFLRDRSAAAPTVAGPLDALAQAAIEADQEIRRRSAAGGS